MDNKTFQKITLSTWTPLCPEKYKQVLEKCTKEFGLPSIHNVLIMYAKLKDYIELEIKLSSDKILVTTLKHTEKGIGIALSEIVLPSNNIYSLCRMLTNICKQSFDIVIGQKLIFNINEDEKISLTEKAIPGSILEYYSTGKINSKTAVSQILDIKFDNLHEQRKHIPKRDFNEVLLDKIGVLNPRISLFCKENKIPINLSKNYKELSNSLSNDFTNLESPYKKISSQELLDTEPLKTDFSYGVPSASIIIPSYNSKKTILKTLESINSQKLKKSALQKIQVLVVDDGSKTPVAEIIEDKEYSFELNIIRLKENMGLSNARNVGASLAKHDILIFIDSDILLANNYIHEMLFRSALIPNALFVSFKKNLPQNDTSFDLGKIKKGLVVPREYSDKRLSRYIDRDNTLVKSAITKNQYVEILGETNYFKNLGNGSIVGTFDLQSMVVGHNMVMRKSSYQKVGGFDTNFKGWGLEDTYFGIKIICAGNFIIPVVSTGVYHIEHPIRLGDKKKQKESFNTNLKLYNELLYTEI
ncbi:MAG: glycosyl transferase, group 2 family protein [candidate division WS6 bacterium GW2011_GWE1_34_7]|uniref:Glycosyl transferase, group 2 family protein n=1 Tax=candidate division WS6 bacterium GW2011_GWE1_34_7 TaxID=1619093 RepID=A0A0G0EDR3_9BACT|nr:MAG: glycosyl transferase, group 2 family protein [candidate division WS6 bacterium GW2011_GWE1_34_7]